MPEPLSNELRGVLVRMVDHLDLTTVRVVDDLIAASEGRFALDMMSRMLVERRACLDVDVIGEVAWLAGRLGLPPTTVERLLPLMG